jgi:hypothetical protein
MNNTEPLDSHRHIPFNPEAQEVIRLFDSTPDFTGTNEECEALLGDLARMENDAEEEQDEAEDFAEDDGQPDWAQEWHDFDPDC